MGVGGLRGRCRGRRREGRGRGGIGGAAGFGGFDLCPAFFDCGVDFGRMSEGGNTSGKRRVMSFEL